MQEALLIDLIKLVSIRVSLIMLIVIISSIFNLICLIFCGMVYWTQRKRIGVQAEILNTINPALAATVRNRKDIIKLAKLYNSMPPERVRMDIIKKLDYQHETIMYTLEHGIKEILKTLTNSMDYIADEFKHRIYIGFDKRKDRDVWK